MNSFGSFTLLLRLYNVNSSYWFIQQIYSHLIDRKLELLLNVFHSMGFTTRSSKTFRLFALLSSASRSNSEIIRQQCWEYSSEKIRNSMAHVFFFFLPKKQRLNEQIHSLLWSNLFMHSYLCVQWMCHVDVTNKHEFVRDSSFDRRLTLVKQTTNSSTTSFYPCSNFV